MKLTKKLCLVAMSALVAIGTVSGSSAGSKNAAKPAAIGLAPRLAVTSPTFSLPSVAQYKAVVPTVSGGDGEAGSVVFDSALMKTLSFSTEGFGILFYNLNGTEFTGGTITAGQGYDLLDCYTSAGVKETGNVPDDSGYLVFHKNSSVALADNSWWIDINFTSVRQDIECLPFFCYDTAWKYSDMIVSGGTKDVYIDVDSAVSQASIVSMVSAKDIFGADVAVTVKSSDYTTGKIGVFTIILNASDNYGNTATGTIKVHVLDKTSPVIKQDSEVSCRYGASLSQTDVLTHFTITDNIDAAPVATFTVPTDFSFDSALKFGTYSLTLKATDASGNFSSLAFSINVYDDVPPVISKKVGETGAAITYGYSSRSTVTESELLSLFQASDAISGACSVYLKTGTVSCDLGSHSVVIGSKDAYGNEAVLTVNYIISADIPPVFILDSRLVQATADSPLTSTELATIVSKVMLFGATNVQLDAEAYSAYSANSGNVGETYSIPFTYTSDTGELASDSLSVYIAEPSKSTGGDSQNWFQKVWSNISAGWNSFWKGVSNFFEKIGNWLNFKGFVLNDDSENSSSSASASNSSN